MTSIARRSVLTALALFLPALAAPQPSPATPKEDESIPKLELAPDQGIDKGRVAAVQGTVGTEGVRYTVGELSILQPIVVMVLARDESDDLTLSLFKKNWTEPRRSGSTRGSGIARFEFRTEGGVNILVRGASAATPFALIVWAGDELHPAMSDIVVPLEEFRKKNPGAAAALEGSRGIPLYLWILIAALGGGAAAFVAFRVLGRRERP